VDSVYKLVEYDEQPVMKLSSAKVSPPGRKQVWRRVEGEHADLLTLRDEDPIEGAAPLLEHVMRGGRRLAPSPALPDARARFEDDLPGVPRKARRLTHPEHVGVPRSAALRELTESTKAEAALRSGAAP
jgi:nicotinate phosphoribosyltransferase